MCLIVGDEFKATILPSPEYSRQKSLNCKKKHKIDDGYFVLYRDMAGHLADYFNMKIRLLL